MTCSSSCSTPGIHQTFGECIRAKSLQVANPEATKSNRNVYSAQDAYRNAREAGLQPDSVSKSAVQRAWKFTDKTGVAYRGDA